MKAYSMDVRRRVLGMCESGRTTREVASVLDVSESWVRRLKQRKRESGSIEPRPTGGRRHGHFDAGRLEQLEAWLRQHPDSTLEWLQARVQREMQLRCSLMAVCRAIKKLGWSLKKNAAGRRTRSPRRRSPAHKLRHRAPLR
ncbi:MAG: helix-turn-helix domain-containing protein [Terriglobia bacterium]